MVYAINNAAFVIRHVFMQHINDIVTVSFDYRLVQVHRGDYVCDVLVGL